MAAKKDPGWNYCSIVDPTGKDKNKLLCIFCSKVLNAGIYRIKQHLAGGYRNATECKKCPKHVKEELKQYMLQKASNKEVILPEKNSKQYRLCFESEFPEMSVSATSNAQSSQASPSIPQMTPPSGESHRTGAINLSPDFEIAAQNKKRKFEKDDYATKKQLRDRACTYIARWMYDAGITFNAVKYKSFHAMIEAIGQNGPNMKPPTFHEVRVSLLKQEVEFVNKTLEEHKQEWSRIGASIMCDGWKDERGRTLINFLVNSAKGSVFIESIDGSDYSKTEKNMFELLSRKVEMVGKENVVQVVTDSTLNNKLAGDLLMAKYPNLYWTPCVAHCLNLMLEDIYNKPQLKKALRNAMKVNSFIYSRPGVLNMMRKLTNKDIMRPAKTRFATASITLLRLHSLKANLRSMFVSDDWSRTKWAKELAGKQVKEIILSPTFWRHILFAIKVTCPLIKVLRIVDGERKPAMGYIYEAMARAKKTIANSFDGDEAKYSEIFQVIDARWNVQLRQPLHAAGYFLNPEFFYKNENIYWDQEIMDGLYSCIERLIPDETMQDKIIEEISMYQKAEGLFGRNMAIRQRDTRAPVEWWGSFGSSTPNLQKFAVKILSLTCSSSGCEQNWSFFEHDGSYPGTGKIDEIGSGNGEGATLNLPLAGGSGDITMRTVFDEVIVPCAQRFKPDIILVSAGYDGHVLDPLANLQFTTGTYYMLSSNIKQLAQDLCGGRCVFFLEGGYNLDSLSSSVADSFRALIGEPSMASAIDNPAILYEEPSSKVQQAIQRIKHIHSL